MPDPETIVAEIDERLLLGESHQYSLQEVKAYFESERCKQMTRLTFRMPGPPASPYDSLPKNTAWVNTFSPLYVNKGHRGRGYYTDEY